MKRTITIAVLVLIFALVAGTAAADSALEITEITVKVNGDEESGADENGGSIGVPPEATLTVKVKVENLLPSNSSNTIDNIVISGIIEAIDDDDDLEEETDDFELNPGRDHTETLTFQIPLRLYTDDIYTMTVTVEGEDEDNVDHSDEVTFDVEADKETHELRFLDKTLSPATVKAGQSTQVKVTVINTGKEDEEDSTLTVEAPDFSYTYSTNFDIMEDIDDSDNEYAYSGYVTVPASAAAGQYPVKARVTYRDGRESIEETLMLNVQAAAVVTPPPQPEEEEEQEEEVEEEEETVKEPEVQVITQPPATQYTQPSANTAVATPRTSYGSAGQSWFDKNKWVAVIVVTDLILLIIGIAIIVAVMKRRRL